MPQTKMIVQAECLDGSHRLKAPATKITAHLERMLNRIPVDVPPQLILSWTGQLGIPMINKIPKQPGLLCLGRIDSLQQAGIRFFVQQLRSYWARGLPTGDDTVEQHILAFTADQSQQALPLRLRAI